jgi:hypothetical protein
MTDEQADDLIKEVKRLNDILLLLAQLQLMPILADDKKRKLSRALDGLQELPKVRTPN